jgi:esterase/lipase superfamily enzyme
MTDTSYAASGAESAVKLLIALASFCAVALGTHKAAKRIAKSADVYHVWYGTNRKRENGSYVTDLDDRLHLGTCKVAIPKSHKIGSTGSWQIVRALQRLRTGADDALYIISRNERSEAEFLKSAERALRLLKTGDSAKHILVYIHGFNNSFDDAIIRAAQIGFDLKVNGITAAFCWASRARLRSYAADEDTARLSERDLAEFLSLLHRKFPAHKINVLAHSMGNRIFLGVLQGLKDYPALADLRFGQIFLAAPDVDARYFSRAAALYPAVSQRTTLYVCSRDLALLGSGDVHQDPRAGYTPPVMVTAGIDTVDASNVCLDRIGHGYFAEAHHVLHDLSLLLQFNRQPRERKFIDERKTDDGSVYWSLRAVK